MTWVQPSVLESSGGSVDLRNWVLRIDVGKNILGTAWNLTTGAFVSSSWGPDGIEMTEERVTGAGLL